MAQRRQRLGQPRAGDRLAPGDAGPAVSSVAAIPPRRGGASPRRRTVHRPPPAARPPGKRRASGSAARWSTSTHLPRIRASPSVCARSRLISAADSVSPSSVTSIWKSSRASMPRCDGRLAADGRLHLRARRPIHAPGRRHPHDDAGAFERGHVLEELHRLPRASSAADDRSRRHRPSPSARRTARRRAGPASAARAGARNSSCRHIPAGPCRAADAAALASADRRVV